MTVPLVSVIIANYNGKNYINKCIQSILNNDYPNLEIILVDDASTDDSLKDIEDKFGNECRLKIIKNKVNLEFVCSNNVGMRNAKGEYLILLNNDTEVDRYWLTEMIEMFKNDSSIGIVQPKLLMLKDRKRIDTCGHYMSFFGLPYEIGADEQDVGQYDKVWEIFGARGAAMTIRRSVLNKIGLFDEAYVVYGEDTDLCWRCWLCGFRVVLASKSIVYHRGGGTLNAASLYRVFYHGTKNNIRTLIKNLSLGNLLWMFPLHIGCRLIMLIFFIMKGRSNDAYWIWKGIFWNIRNFKENLKERFKVQRSIRRTLDYQLLPIMFGNLSFLSIIKRGLSWVGRI